MSFKVKWLPIKITNYVKFTCIFYSRNNLWKHADISETHRIFNKRFSHLLEKNELNKYRYMYILHNLLINTADLIFFTLYSHCVYLYMTWKIIPQNIWQSNTKTFLSFKKHGIYKQKISFRLAHEMPLLQNNFSLFCIFYFLLPHHYYQIILHKSTHFSKFWKKKYKYKNVLDLKYNSTA